MNRKPVTRALSQTFTLAFLITVGCFVAMVILGATTPEHKGITPLEGFLLLLMVAGAWTWYIALGVIASRLGRRWLVWTGLSFITAPIGPFIAYPLMLGHIKSARETGAEGVGAGS